MRPKLFNMFASFLQILLLMHALYPVNSLAAQSACPVGNATTYRFAHDSDWLAEAYDTLVSCPNLTNLDLIIGLGGCVGSDEPRAFKFRHGDKFPTLRNLTLSGYDFEYTGLPFGPKWNKLLDVQYHIGRMRNKIRVAQYGSLGPEYDPNLEKWLRAMDWTQVERLEIDDNPYFWERMKHEMPGLRHLSTRIENMSEYEVRSEPGSSPLGEFLASVPPLETLSVHAVSPIVDNNHTLSCRDFHLERLLSRHGASLHTLSLSQDESLTPSHRRIACDASDIASIYALCPHLTHLTLDLDRDGTWSNETLMALVSSSSLHTLHLRLELGANLHANEFSIYYDWSPEGITQGGPFREPRIDIDVAEALFRDLQAHKIGEPLTRLVLDVGDFDTPPWSGPLYLPSWEEGRARRFVCEVQRSPSISDGGKDVLDPVCVLLGNDRDPFDW